MVQVLSKGSALKPSGKVRRARDTAAPIEYKGTSAPRVRFGKTRKDHQSGAWSNRFANRAARVAEQHSSGWMGKVRKG